MGVTVLHLIHDTSPFGFKEVEKIQTRIVGLGGQQSGHFQVDCDTYYTKEQNVPGAPPVPSKKLHVMHNSETPASTYAVIEGPNKQVTLSADLIFDLLLPRLSHMYTGKKNLKVESKGSRYIVGDFIVKLGTVTVSSSHYKGILVEVEYLPCTVPALCWAILREFMQSFMGSCVPQQAPLYIKKRYHDAYNPQDTIEQYLEKFNELRESSNQQHNMGGVTGTPQSSTPS